MKVAIELVLLVGLLLFARGFLPPTRTKLGFSDVESPVPAQFDRMVFMVVDAMRSDFMFSTDSKMHTVHKLITDGHAFPFTAFSDPPTVTLPRLKGLTTGSSPNFLDAVINIAESDSASTLANQDSWIEQLTLRNKSIHMLGDNTWLKLFPAAFTFSDGTDSFFVSDFTEVDRNVTRHLDEELSQKKSASNNWDVLVLHYLGLDHIGHKSGPRGTHMPAKQKEMDCIIEKIYSSLDDRTLLVVLGDHGMNDIGNHGGASQGETSAALAFFSKRFSNNFTETSPLPVSSSFSYHKRVMQIDIVPTISLMLGLPIPKNSLGVTIQNMLKLWSKEDQDRILRLNCEQLGIDTPGCSWDQLRETQQVLMRSSSQHILGYMYAGIAVICLVSCAAIYKCYGVLISQSGPREGLWVWWIVIPSLLFASMMGSSTVEEEHYFWYWSLSGLLVHAFVVYGSARKYMLIILIAYRVIRGWNSTGQKWTSASDVGKFLIEHPLLNVVMAAETLVLLVLLSSSRTVLKHTYLGLGIESFDLYSDRSLDPTRQNSSAVNTSSEWATQQVTTKVPHLSSLNSSQSSQLTSLIVISEKQKILSPKQTPTATQVPEVGSSISPSKSSYVSPVSMNAPQQISSSMITILAKSCTILAAIAVFLFKLGSTGFPLNSAGMLLTARASYAFALLSCAFGATDIGIILILIMQTKLQNIPLWLFVYAARRSLLRVYESTGDAATCTLIGLCFEYTCFFAFGGSNSLATIDLSNAYNGISGYNIPLVAVLTYLGNWAPSFYWSLLPLSNGTRILRSMVLCVLCSGVSLACLILREHLFIWTVFSPKLLYVVSWLVFHEFIFASVASFLINICKQKLIKRHQSLFQRKHTELQRNQVDHNKQNVPENSPPPLSI